MAFTPEDGTGLSTATSLVSLSYANAYWAERPDTAGAWSTATDAQKQAALMTATRRICRESFHGSPLSGTQALELPRYWPEIKGRTWDGMPAPILEACCELARHELDESITEPLDRGGEIASEQVGPIATSYFAGAPSEKAFPYVQDLLAPFLEFGAGGGQAELVLG